ncbi:MAG: hypothetical protein ACTHJ2_09000 [Candidatus Nitrosocosmicus sp.]
MGETLSSILKKEQKILKKNFGEIKKTTIGALYADQNMACLITLFKKFSIFSLIIDTKSSIDMGF